MKFHRIQLIFVLAVCALQVSTERAEAWFDGEDHGFEIIMHTPAGGIVQQAGTSTVLSCDIRWVNAQGTSRGKPPKDLQKELSFHAFFPDSFTDVTKQVIIDWKAGTCLFLTPKLISRDQGNVFSLAIEVTPPPVDHRHPYRDQCSAPAPRSSRWRRR